MMGVGATLEAAASFCADIGAGGCVGGTAVGASAIITVGAIGAACGIMAIFPADGWRNNVPTNKSANAAVAPTATPRKLQSIHLGALRAGARCGTGKVN